MSVWQLIEAMDRVVHPGAPAGTRWRASARVRSATAEHEVTVAARVDPQGRRREQYFCDGVRLDRALLLRLTCTDAECPEARAVRERWDGGIL